MLHSFIRLKSYTKHFTMHTLHVFSVLNCAYLVIFRLKCIFHKYFVEQTYLSKKFLRY